MKTNHALFFVWNTPRDGRESQAMECFELHRKYWGNKKDKGEIATFEYVTLASTGNNNMPVGFFLVTGEREQLQNWRWNDEEFLNLHTMTISCFNGYACIDGYAGEGFDAHMSRFSKLMSQK